MRSSFSNKQNAFNVCKSLNFFSVSGNPWKSLNIMTLNFRCYPLKMWAATNVMKSKTKLPIDINTMASPWHSVRRCNLKEKLCVLKIDKIGMNDYQASFLFSLPRSA